eukprot:1984960-Amphidinium_carterae.1
MPYTATMSNKLFHVQGGLSSQVVHCYNNSNLDCRQAWDTALVLEALGFAPSLRKLSWQGASDLSLLAIT